MVSTIDKDEIEKFTRMADEWWDEGGKFKTLHSFNPVRIAFIKKKILQHFGGKEDLNILDVGCGGGLICEPFARMGFEVTGIDASEKNIKIAELHAKKSGLKVDYENKAIEEMPDNGKKFDVILALEIIEHVADVEEFIENLAKFLKPGGLVFVATLNRTLKSIALAKFAVEYILRWLPVGTHDFRKFLKPSEINEIAEKVGLVLDQMRGFEYSLLSDAWNESNNVDVNYIMTFHNS